MLQLCPKETQRKNKSLTRVKSIIKKPSCCWETTNAWKEPRKKKNFPLQQVPSINYCNGPSEANSGENLILLRQVLNIECRGHYGKPCGCTPLGFQLVIGWWLSGYFQVLRGYCLREKKRRCFGWALGTTRSGKLHCRFFLLTDFVDAKEGGFFFWTVFLS